MESKTIEYGIILLYKYKVEYTEVIYRLLSTFITHKTFGQDIYIFLIYISFTAMISRVQKILIQSHFESIQITQSKDKVYSNT